MSRLLSSFRKYDGAELHAKIPAENWGVTKDDLVTLKRRVWRAVRKGEIVPTDRDQFDPKDSVFGPAIYTINEQYIKPVTAKAGNMSWALMRNPHGRKCDIFVTHAWQEGIFEFINKVLGTWPMVSGGCCRRKSAAWCCMLANPQNLDIASLISTPINSPFARALRASQCVLVVANRRESIYTRLWCVYEAYLACQWDKVVLTACPLRRTQGGKTEFLILTALITAAFAFGTLINIRGTFEHLVPPDQWDNIFTIVTYFAMTGALTTEDLDWHRQADLLISALAGILAGACFHFSRDGIIVVSWTALGNAISAVVFTYLSERDRLADMLLRREWKHLKAGYRGTCRQAQCSVGKDSEAIWNEISGETGVELEKQVNLIDETIELLIRAGISSRNLQSAAAAGVDITGANSGESSAFMVYFTLTGFETTGKQKEVPVLVMDMIFKVTLTLGWMLYLRTTTDNRIFVNRTFVKLVIMLAWPVSIGTTIARHYLGHSVEAVQIIVLACNILCCIVFVLACLLGVGGMAKIPRVGRPLAEFCLQRSIWKWWRARPRRKAASDRGHDLSVLENGSCSSSSCSSSSSEADPEVYGMPNKLRTRAGGGTKPAAPESDCCSADDSAVSSCEESDDDADENDETGSESFPESRTAAELLEEPHRSGALRMCEHCWK
mmetsp:Transcript_13404/g.29525  ORF Transcript_13404/g.29525 Transcript_13404/m.29525 type:complete len:667 (-) Transcript_13404:432-2432(-)